MNKIFFLSLIVIVIYVISFGIAVAICKHSKIFSSFEKATFKSNYKRKEFTGLFILLGPISVVFYVLVLLGWLSYSFTKYCLGE